jgi:hypothetical protein
MSIRLVTAGGLDLNSTTYRIVRFDLGPIVRDEVFLEPFMAANATFVAKADRKTQMTIGLKVTAASTTALKAAVDAIRDELFSGTTLSYSFDSGVIASKTITTFPYACDPVDLQDPATYIATRLGLIIPKWILRPWRQAYAAGDTKALVI